MRASIHLSLIGVTLAALTAAGCTSGAPAAPTAPPPSGAATPAAEAAPPAAAAAAAPAEKPKNTLRWTTASEVDNFGFDVYRAIAEDGPFERITTSIIPGAGTTDEPQKYVYVDDSIDPTKGYFYYIESISIDSVREKFSPVIAIGPKQPAAE